MKIEAKTGTIRPLLKLDVCLLTQLRGRPGFPELVTAGRTEHFNFCVMKYVGPDLEKLQNLMPTRRFTASTAYRLAFHTLDSLEELHNKGWLHRDLKAQNFAVGLGNDSAQVYMLDFGMARNFRNGDGQVRGARSYGPYCGTYHYNPLAAQYCRDQGPKDDLEGWFYMNMHMMRGHLPWHLGHELFDHGAVREWKEHMKKAFKRNFFNNLPSEWETIYDMIMNLRYEEVPAYNSIRKLLNNIVLKLNIPMSVPLDWQCIPPLVYEMNRAERALCDQTETADKMAAPVTEETQINATPKVKEQENKRDLIQMISVLGDNQEFLPPLPKRHCGVDGFPEVQCGPIEQPVFSVCDNQEFAPPLPKRHCAGILPVPSDHPILRQLLSAPPPVPPHQPKLFQPGPQATVTHHDYVPYPISFNGFPYQMYPNYVNYQQQGFPYPYGYNFPTNYNVPLGFNGFPTQPIASYQNPAESENRKRKASEVCVAQVGFISWSRSSLIYLALLKSDNHSGSINTILQFLNTIVPSLEIDNTKLKGTLRSFLEKKDLFEKIKTLGKRHNTYRLIDPESALTEIQKEMRSNTDLFVANKFPELFPDFVNINLSKDEEIAQTSSMDTVQSVPKPHEVNESEWPDIIFDDEHSNAQFVSEIGCYLEEKDQYFEDDDVDKIKNDFDDADMYDKIFTSDLDSYANLFDV